MTCFIIEVQSTSKELKMVLDVDSSKEIKMKLDEFYMVKILHAVHLDFD